MLIHPYGHAHMYAHVRTYTGAHVHNKRTHAHICTYYAHAHRGIPLQEINSEAKSSNLSGCLGRRDAPQSLCFVDAQIDPPFKPWLTHTYCSCTHIHTAHAHTYILLMHTHTYCSCTHIHTAHAHTYILLMHTHTYCSCTHIHTAHAHTYILLMHTHLCTYVCSIMYVHTYIHTLRTYTFTQVKSWTCLLVLMASCSAPPLMTGHSKFLTSLTLVSPTHM